MDPGHCELRLTRRYDATPAEVWAALTEPESLERRLAADGEGTLLVLDHRRIDERFGMTYISRKEDR